MKYCVEYGVRGGAYTENLIIDTAKQAAKLAASLVAVFCNNNLAFGAKQDRWKFDNNAYRITWNNETHFIAVSKLDGVERGPASTELWSKPETEPPSFVCRLKTYHK